MSSTNKQIILTTPRGNTTVVPVSGLLTNTNETNFKDVLLKESQRRDVGSRCCSDDRHHSTTTTLSANNTHLQIIHQGKEITSIQDLIASGVNEACCYYLSFKLPIVGGMDRQNRAGSKFGGGGVSSSQHQERERKERLKQLALESIDLAKDPYLMRNHLGTYECKLCLTLHTNEANYLAHTQGKKHQQGLARRAHMEKLKAEKEGTTLPTPTSGSSSSRDVARPTKRIRIGRPAYQVFKSRDADTNQRCLSFELNFPEIEHDLQPRHRFMSAFEQKVESPPDRRFQYLLFAAEPYETVAFKIPNDPIDKAPGRFVTHWDTEEKKFTVTLYFIEQSNPAST